MPKRRLRVVVLAAGAMILPLPALADEVCVAVRPSDQDDSERKYEIWLERGPQVDFSYAWSCVAKTGSSTSDVSNSSFAFRKPDQDDKLGACSTFIEPGAQVKITVDLSIAPQPPATGDGRKLGTMTFDFDPTTAAKAKRQCRAL